MQGDSLSLVDAEVVSYGPSPTDATVAMARPLEYSGDSTLYQGSGFWFHEVVDYFRQRDSFGMRRHQAMPRPDKTASESLLMGLLLLQAFLLAFLLNRGIRMLGRFTSLSTVSESSDSLPQPGSGPFLWLISTIVFSLTGHVLIGSRLTTDGGVFDSTILFRVFIYTISFMVVLGFLYRLLAVVFFHPLRSRMWMANNTTLFFYLAMALSPVLIGAEIGILKNATFVFWWVVVCLLLSRSWMLLRSMRIFSGGKHSFFYWILYLCALEILPMILFYKGLFLL